MTHHLTSIIRLQQHGVIPKVVKHLLHTYGHEKLLCFLKESNLGPALKKKKKKLVCTFDFCFSEETLIQCIFLLNCKQWVGTFATMVLLTSISGFSGYGILWRYRFVQNRPHMSPKKFNTITNYGCFPETFPTIVIESVHRELILQHVSASTWRKVTHTWWGHA